MAKEGKDTTEFKLTEKVSKWFALAPILALVVKVGEQLMGMNLLPEGSLLYVILGSIVAVSGLVLKYVHSREAKKVGEIMKESAEATAKGVAATAQAVANPK